MARDSEYYKNKQKKQTLKLRSLLDQLPDFCVDFIYSKELTTQTSTLISYSYDLLTFLRFLREKNPQLRDTAPKSMKLENLKQIQSEDILEYQRYLSLNVDGEYHENGKKAIARKMSALRGMYKYQLIHKHISEDPTALVAMPRLKKDKNIVRMNNYEVQDILNAIRIGNQQMSDRQRKYCLKTQQRDLAILTILLNTGMRVSECRGLDLNDVNLIENSLVIVRKGGGQDIIYFGKPVHLALSDYIEGERQSICPLDGHQQALFYSLQGKRISIDAIEKTVKKYARIAVPGKHITPHKLRSTYGTALYRETGDIRLVADVLGHENINTTIDYYAAIEDEHKRQAANAVDFNRKDIHPDQQA